VLYGANVCSTNLAAVPGLMCTCCRCWTMLGNLDDVSQLSNAINTAREQAMQNVRTLLVCLGAGCLRRWWCVVGHVTDVGADTFPSLQSATSRPQVLSPSTKPCVCRGSRQWLAHVVPVTIRFDRTFQMICCSASAAVCCVSSKLVVVGARSVRLRFACGRGYVPHMLRSNQHLRTAQLSVAFVDHCHSIACFHCRTRHGCLWWDITCVSWESQLLRQHHPTQSSASFESYLTARFGAGMLSLERKSS